MNRPDHPFALRETLLGSLDQLTHLAACRGMLLTFEAGHDLPDLLVGQRPLITQVVTILVTNALQHSSGGTIALRVGEAYRDDSELWLHVSVTDSGPGIDSEKIAALFEHQPGAPSRGLPIARRLVEQMRGDLWVESMPGHGSIFQFTAPVQLPPPAPASGAGPGIEILLVDDLEINRELARVVMERQGYRVSVATSGSEALAQFRRTPFDLVFMDIQMPEMDGYQTSRALRAEEARRGNASRVPIVAMTAYASKESRSKCREAGMDGFISKPAKADDILGAIRRFAAASCPAPAPAGGEESAQPRGENAALIFDRSELLERLCGKAEMIPRFTGMFVTSVTAALEPLHRAVADADAKEIHRQAHTIKGAAANIGAERVCLEATALDEAAKAERLSGTGEMLAALVAEFESFKALIGTTGDATDPRPDGSNSS